MKLDKYGKIEGTKLDFKEKVEFKKAKSWLKTVSAFSNTQGGLLIFGVEDKTREIIGVDDIEETSERISKMINDRILPRPNFEIRTEAKGNKEILIVEVTAGPTTPYYCCSDNNKEVFIRSGESTIIASENELSNLILKGKNITYDQIESNYKISDVSFTLLDATYKNETGNDINKEKDYISFGLVKNGNLTNAGLLLADQSLLKQSRVICTKWNGLVKGTIGEAIDDKEYTGSIISILENVETFIRNNSKISWQIEGMQRIEKADYPLKAVREVIVNALMHRDYQIIGSEIHIDMFDDRLEIVSPGGMYDGSLIQELDIKRVPSMRRNVVIADVFTILHYMDRRGSGLSRILNEYNDFDKKPKFYSTNSSFSVIFPNKGYKENNEIVKDNSKLNTNIVYVKLLKSNLTKKTMRQIIDLFSEFETTIPFNREKIENKLGVKRSRARDIILKMEELDLIIQENKMYKFKI